MAFTGYQGGANEDNAAMQPVESQAPFLTSHGFVEGVTWKQFLQGSGESTFDRISNPANQGSLNAAIQDMGYVQLYNSKRSAANQFKQMTGMKVDRDPDWNPTEAIKGLGPKYRPYYDQLLNTQNSADFGYLIEDIDNAKNRQATMSSGSYNEAATLITMGADPLNFIPIASGASVLNKTARASTIMGVEGRMAKIGASLTPMDRDFAIRTMWAEARNQGDEGLAAVGNVILNRAASGRYGNNIREVVTARNQFEPWGNSQTRSAMMNLSPHSPEYQRIGSIFDQIATGAVPDITNGADMFFSPKSQAALGRKNPKWSEGTPAAVVGDHNFYWSNGNPIDKAARAARDQAYAAFALTETGAAIETFSQMMANPDFSSSDAIGIMGTATMLGLGGGSVVATLGQMRANKIALAQTEYNTLLRNKLSSLDGFGDAPEMFSIKNMSKSVTKGDEAFTRDVGDWFTNRDVIFGNLTDSFGIQPKSVGAAAFTSTDPVELYRISGVAKFLRYTNPILDTVSGMSNSAKRVMGGLYDNNLLTNENMEGIATTAGGSVATSVRVEMGRLAKFQNDMKGLFEAFQTERMNQGLEPINRQQFEREVWLGTFGASTMQSDKFISEGVSKFRKEITHPTLKSAQDVGLIKKGAGEDYSPVIFNRQAVRGNIDGFKDAVRRAALKGYDDYQMNKIGKKPSFDPYKDPVELEKFVEDYTAFWADETDAAIVGMETQSGRLKNRVEQPLKYTEMQDFMENTIGDVASRYMRSMTPDIELMRKYGSVDLKNERTAVKKEYEQKLKAAPNAAARKVIEKERDRIMDNLDWAVKNIRNRDDYSVMTSDGLRTAIKGLNLWTFTKGMGMFPINALAESSIPLLVHGWSNTYGTLMKDFHNEFAGLKMARELALTAGIATDKALGDRMTAIMDGTNIVVDQTSIERKIDSFMGGAAKLFGVPQINDTFRSMSTMWNNNMFGKDIATIASGRGKMDDMTRARYANLGIDKETATAMFEQMEKHGEWIGENWAPNLDKWDADVARSYKTALMKAVDNEFIIPQAADMPKIAQTPWGKPLFFLRSYVFASTNRLALANLQRGMSPDMAKGMAGIMAMGMLSNALYQAVNGREQPEGIDMVYGAMDRAGVFGLFWEANKMMDKTVGIGLGDGDQTRSYSNPIEQIGGPNAFTVGDAVDFISQPTMSNAGDLMPLGNWLPLEAAKRTLMQ